MYRKQNQDPLKPIQFRLNMGFYTEITIINIFYIKSLGINLYKNPPDRPCGGKQNQAKSLPAERLVRKRTE
jgi:hypothetical protein